MRLGLAARDSRLLALLLLLGASAAALVVSSWPRPGDTAPEPTRGENASVAQSTPFPERVPPAGRRVATRFAEAYFTTTWRDSAAARKARLEPYSSDELIAEMGADSGALALRQRDSKTRARRAAEVVALQNQDGTPGHALVAIVKRTTVGNNKTATELVTVTLELIERDGAWLVDEVLVP